MILVNVINYIIEQFVYKPELGFAMWVFKCVYNIGFIYLILYLLYTFCKFIYKLHLVGPFLYYHMTKAKINDMDEVMDMYDLVQSRTIFVNTPKYYMYYNNVFHYLMDLYNELNEDHLKLTENDKNNIKDHIQEAFVICNTMTNDKNSVNVEILERLDDILDTINDYKVLDELPLMGITKGSMFNIACLNEYHKPLYYIAYIRKTPLGILYGHYMKARQDASFYTHLFLENKQAEMHKSMNEMISDVKKMMESISKGEDDEDKEI